MARLYPNASQRYYVEVRVRRPLFFSAGGDCAIASVGALAKDPHNIHTSDTMSPPPFIKAYGRLTTLARHHHPEKPMPPRETSRQPDTPSALPTCVLHFCAPPGTTVPYALRHYHVASYLLSNDAHRPVTAVHGVDCSLSRPLGGLHVGEIKSRAYLLASYNCLVG